MKPQGKEFNRLNSLYKTLQQLQPIAGNYIWLMEFKLISHEHLRFVELLLQTLCTQGICCAISRTYSWHFILCNNFMYQKN